MLAVRPSRRSTIDDAARPRLRAGHLRGARRASAATSILLRDHGRDPEPRAHRRSSARQQRASIEFTLAARGRATGIEVGAAAAMRSGSSADDLQRSASASSARLEEATDADVTAARGRLVQLAAALRPRRPRARPRAGPPSRRRSRGRSRRPPWTARRRARRRRSRGRRPRRSPGRRPRSRRAAGSPLRLALVWKTGSGIPTSGPSIRRTPEALRVLAAGERVAVLGVGDDQRDRARAAAPRSRRGVAGRVPRSARAWPAA